jgi:hypothetical protein
MKLNNRNRSVSVLRISTLALAMTAAHAFAGAASEPVYDPATEVEVRGTVAAIHQAASGAALAGVHMTVQMKTGPVDVYLGPSEFLKFLKVGFKTGEQIEVVGSKVKSENADVILSRQVDDGYALINLRDASGVADWKSWGQEVDPSAVQ